MKKDENRKYEDRKYEGRKYEQIRQNGMFLMAAAAVALIMYHFCRVNDSDALTWILTPTARWVSVFGGIPFDYLPHRGYVNHDYRFLIAPSCAGCRFLLIAFLMMVSMNGTPDAVCGYEEERGMVPAVRKYYAPGQDVAGNAKECSGKGIRRRGLWKRWLWFGCSLLFAYLSTIVVNGIRIVLSIYLPPMLADSWLMESLLTPDRLHTLTGTVVYFVALCVIYPAAASICRSVFRAKGEQDILRSKYSCFGIPAFWYLLVVLALPFVKRLYHHDLTGFAPYAAVIVGACGSICGTVAVGRWIKARILCNRKSA